MTEGARIGGRKPRATVLYGAILAFGLVAAAVAAVALVLVIGLSRDHSELQDHNVPYAVAISSAALEAKAIANHERGFLISGRQEFLDEIDQNLLKARNAFAEAQFAADDDVQLRAAAKAENGFERWVVALQRQLRMFQRGGREQATAAALGPGRALRKSYEASLAEAQRVAVTAIDLQKNSFASSGWIFVVLAMLIVVLAGGFGLTFALAHVPRRTGEAEPAEPSAAALSLVPQRDRRNA